MSALPKYRCQVCGTEAEPEVVAAMALHHYDYWVMHRIERKGGIIQVLTCPACTTLTEELIFETYRERIREGLIPGFH